MSKKAKKVASAATTEKKAAEIENTATEAVKDSIHSQDKHIKPGDKGWDKYLRGLKADIEALFKSDTLTFYPAWRGFLDDEDLGYPNLYDFDTMMQILMAAGFCPECSANFLEHCFLKETGKGGKLLHYCMFSKDKIELSELEDRLTEHLVGKDNI